MRTPFPGPINGTRSGLWLYLAPEMEESCSEDVASRRSPSHFQPAAFTPHQNTSPPPPRHFANFMAPCCNRPCYLSRCGEKRAQRCVAQGYENEATHESASDTDPAGVFHTISRGSGNGARDGWISRYRFKKTCLNLHVHVICVCGKMQKCGYQHVWGGINRFHSSISCSVGL